ncbi:hypothetical protein COT30_00230 [Candidatus Micrarchaeota archaeon CG08_land_8_20_14_0_20_49_17]|nr:MAG: hypothetical protein COT30_00230 [Candidatus Micrarchaeota archaeon CG08_land_8_20_14_0_20_49_17]PIZ96882.1 MAG: hypothetical protein COX84_03580 [Candidatus Micrarchaeota archaeon CG_4_10_14_0_2_um_filter_49_7]
MVTFGYLLINGVNYLLPIYGLAVVLVTYFGTKGASVEIVAAACVIYVMVVVTGLVAGGAGKPDALIMYTFLMFLVPFIARILRSQTNASGADATA